MHSGKGATMAGAMEAGKIMGDWKFVKNLGKGSYGTVELLQNSKTKAQIALKKYQVNSISSGSLEAKCLRNKAEVQRIKKVNHPHIVSTIDVPLDVRRAYFGCRETGNEDHSAPEDESDARCLSPMPLLAMEYCSGGDLRQMLRRPENVNGLSEKDVRLVLLHISKAISYLHTNGMVHRDIKPENILIQHRGSEPVTYKLGDLGSTLDSIEKKVLDGVQKVSMTSETVQQATYKLADLGFAKDLPPTGSTCSTQLGTKPYLAPEINGEKYNGKRVDYWSFGVVAFEIICGRHPFLGESPEVWLPWIEQQRICGPIIGLREVQKDGKIIYMPISKFPCPTRLSQVLRECLEAWLPSMLEIHPKRRGQFPGEIDSNALTRLQNIINCPVVHVRYFSRSLTYVLRSKTTVASIKRKIQKDLDIPETEQIILAPCGLLLCDSELLEKYSETAGLYLLRRNECLSKNFILPTSLVTFLNGNEWTESRSADENQKLFADAIGFFQTEIDRVETLTDCCKAMVLHHQKAYADVETEFYGARSRLQAVIEIQERKLLQEADYPIPKDAFSMSVITTKTDAHQIFQSSQAILLECQKKIPLQTFPVQSLVKWYKKALQLYQEFRAKRSTGSSVGSIPSLAKFICKFGVVRTSIVADANKITHWLSIGSANKQITQMQTFVKKLNDLKERLTVEVLKREKKRLKMEFSRCPEHVPSPQPTVVNVEMQRAANVCSMNRKIRDKPKPVFETNLASLYPQPSSNTSSSLSTWDDEVFKANVTSPHSQATSMAASSVPWKDVLKVDVAKPQSTATNNTGSPPTPLDILYKKLAADKAQNEFLQVLLDSARNLPGHP